jgi:hypothetical protein
VLFNLLQIFRGAAVQMTRKCWVKTEILASLGRLAGLLVLLLYLAPMFLRAANYDSGGVLARIITATSFVSQWRTIDLDFLRRPERSVGLSKACEGSEPRSDEAFRRDRDHDRFLAENVGNGPAIDLKFVTAAGATSQWDALPIVQTILNGAWPAD